jgi:hypothetical protein
MKNINAYSIKKVNRFNTFKYKKVNFKIINKRKINLKKAFLNLIKSNRNYLKNFPLSR